MQQTLEFPLCLLSYELPLPKATGSYLVLKYDAANPEQHGVFKVGQ